MRYGPRLALTACIGGLMAAGCAEGAPSPEAGRGGGDTLRIAQPTGVKDVDRANVQAVFDSVRSGETVLFGAGMYMLGEGVHLRTPDVTVLGHPGGTVLRSCDPEAFEIDESEFLPLVFGCTGLLVQAERQTIRDLTIEYAWHGIVVGPYPATAEEAAATQGILPPYPVGGQRIEGNTFRATPNGMRVMGLGEDVSVVRDNDFIDVFHAIGIYGGPLHFVGNRVTVTDPGRVPTSGHPGSAILVSPQHTDCAGHVVAENRVEGHPGAIYVLAARGETCRDVEIRDNDIRVARVHVPPGWVTPIPTPDDSTMVGVPITLSTSDWTPPGAEGDLPEGVVEGVVVRGNRVTGAEGIGILVNASRSRIAGNVITDIRRRQPFPGINWDPALVTWEVGNGSGIWVSPRARENEITGNVFERVEGASITLEGDDNRVELLAPTDSDRDLGSNNRITRPTRAR